MKTEMSEEAKQARREYMRAWRKKNPDKQRQYSINRWERLAKKMQEEQDD